MTVLRDGRTRCAIMSELRAYVFRQKAFEAESKAYRAQISEPTRRAWLIVAREWTKMAEKEEAQPQARNPTEP